MTDTRDTELRQQALAILNEYFDRLTYSRQIDATISYQNLVVELIYDRERAAVRAVLGRLRVPDVNLQPGGHLATIYEHNAKVDEEIAKLDAIQ